MKSIIHLIPATFIFLFSCNSSGDEADAYGNFEAIEVIVSAEAQGKIEKFEPMEGSRLEKGQKIIIIDTIQLTLKKEQLESGKSSLGAKIKTLEAQVKASNVQMVNLQREKGRIDNLVEGGAATTKQQDDLAGQIELLKAQIAATESQKSSVHSERKTLDIQIRQVEDQLWKSTVRNPVEGVMLTKYKEQGELAIPGQPLYKIANLDELVLRAYLSGNQLSSVKTGSQVTVRFDAENGLEETSGIVSWISPRAEFTPKIIQTREERVNLVYAIKVLVPNDGRLKIGMPGEIIF